MPPAHDRLLVERCVKKDPIAWARLVKRYSGLIGISIENILKKYSFPYSKSDTDDIRQNLIISIWKDNKLSGVKNRDDISYWLAIVAANAARDHMRRKISHGAFEEISIHEHRLEGLIKEFIEDIPSEAPTPKDEAIRREAEESLKEAFAGLAPKERLIAKLSLLHEKRYVDIAKMTRSPLGTVSSSVKRLKDKLRRNLKKYLQ